MDDFLSGQVCLVTGGAQGIGWATAQALAHHGGEVYIGDISQENLAAAQAQLPSLPWGGRLHLERVDVADRPGVEDWIRRVHERTGHVDVLVNNAVFVRSHPVTEMPVEASELSMRVGYFGMVYTIKAALPLMLQAGRGAIVNMGSSAGEVFVGGISADYGAVKAAINAYTQLLAVELQDTPIHVMLVRPGVVAGTDFLKKHVPSTVMPALADRFRPLTPPDVAAAIVRGLRRRRAVVDIPWYLTIFYLLSDLSPRFFYWLSYLGGQSKKDYGRVSWKYTGQERTK